MPKEVLLPVIESDSLKIAHEGAQNCIAIAEDICGHQHPFTRDTRKTFSRLAESIAVTDSLISQSEIEWKRPFISNRITHASLLHNFLTYDFQRFYPLSILLQSMQVLHTGMYEPQGYIHIPFQTENNPLRRSTYRFGHHFASRYLKFTDNSEDVYTAYDDPRVPFIYLYAQPLGKLTPHIQQVFDTMAALVRNEPITPDWPLNTPQPTISQQARNELLHCGCIVLHPYNEQYIAEPTEYREAPATILLPIKDLPWIKPDNTPVPSLYEIVLSQLEHEASHLADFRRYENNIFSASLLETRAFLRQYDFHRRYNQYAVISKANKYTFAAYLNLMQGFPSYTHLEELYSKSIYIAAQRLSFEQMQRVTPHYQNYARHVQIPPGSLAADFLQFLKLYYTSNS